MPALNFLPRFAEAVELGHKLQTIRAPRADGRPHCKVGDWLKLYTGQRTEDCRLLGEARVTRIAKIRIDATSVWIDGRCLPATLTDRHGPQTDGEFAQADGFDDFLDLRDWI